MKGTDKRKWVRLLVMLPLVIALVFVNVYQDPANLYHDDSASMADAILRGQEPYFYSANGDDRGVKHRLIQKMPKELDCVTIGPSLTLGISREMVGTDNYYNLSVSEASFSDIMAEFALLDINEIKVKKVILCVDSYFFDNTHANVTKRPEWVPYCEYMKSKLDGGSPEIPSEDIPFFSQENVTRWGCYSSQALSLSYFQASCELVKSRGAFFQKTRCGIIDEDTKDFAHFTTDGSWVYSAKYRESTVDNVIDEANKFLCETEFEYGSHVSEDKFYYFDQLIKYLVEKDIEVEIFLCPFCPTLWDRLEIDKEDSQCFILKEIENHTLEVAEQYGLKVIGDYNPYVCGVEDSDFWDSRHMKYDMIDQHFEF